MDRAKLVFNKTIAGMLLDNPRIKKVEEWQNCVFVLAAGMRPQFVSKKDFFTAFVQVRKERSQNLSIWKTSSNTYTVHNPESGNRYTVTLKTTHLTCTCEDYSNQVRIWGKGACKHIYRTLSEIQCSSLREYEQTGLDAVQRTA